MKNKITRFSTNNSLHLTADFTVKLSEGFSPFDRFSGFTFTPFSMSQDAPHGGEMHPDGDEIVYIFSGKIEVTLELEEEVMIQVGEEEGIIIPKGIWHKIHVVDPVKGVILSPGPSFEYRELNK